MRIIVLLLLATLSLAAQMPRGIMNWWDSPLARDLNLSVDQQRQIRDTIREFRPKLIDLRAATEKAEIEVEDAFNDESLDQRRANEAIERLATSRADMIRTVSQLSLRMRGVLTPDQWSQLRSRQQQQRQQRRGQMPMRRGPMGRGPAATPPPDLE